MAQYRYPGAQPFTTAQEHIFFGREQDISALYRLIRLEPLIVLYSKSGLGKSSLLNAGVVPRILEEGKYRPVNIRFNAYSRESDSLRLPLATTREAILAASESRDRETFLGQLLPADDSLWYLLKKEQAYSDGRNRLLLMFDQFEELFTYPEEAIQAFKQELGEVLHTQIPQQYRERVEQEVEAPEHLNSEQLTLLHQSADTKVVMAIRSDRISLLDRIADHLPLVKRSWYELDALSREKAEDAILNPAYKKGEFQSPVFDYDDEALERIIRFLNQDGSQKIESFQLQILCQAIERKVIQRGLALVSAADLGNIEEIYENYYEDQMSLLTDPAERLAARRLIEEGLVFEDEERRLSLYEGQIHRQYGLSEALLRKLEDTHLIRREPSLRGGYTYELSHDTLVAPVLKAKALRMEEERRQSEEAALHQREAELAEAKKKAEEERMLREKAQESEGRARQRTRLAVVVSMLALALALLAFWSYRQANKAREEANQSALDAEAALQLADDNLRKAKVEEAKAKAALQQVEAEKAATEEQRLKAEENFRRAEQATREAQVERDNAKTALANLEQANASTVRLLLNNADRDLLSLQYEDALEKIKAAAALGALKPEVAEALLEIAFWYGELGEEQRAWGILDTALALVNRGVDKGRSVREAVEAFNPQVYRKLRDRYYPVMLEVEGGKFNMGCDTGIDENCNKNEILHQQEVSTFQMAKYETTWWHYCLFCRATGREYESPSWGMQGDNPAVNVSWFDAADYANWVSRQLKVKEIMVKKADGNYILLLRGGYRLPTEAEWEYAAKGGTYHSPFIYSGGNELDSVGWYSDNSRSRTEAVGTKKGNPLGLYDMSGNVYEWCWDWYDKYPSDPVKDYFGPADGSRRVIRGGSWNNYAAGCRSAFRNGFAPADRYSINGFRLVFVP